MREAFRTEWRAIPRVAGLNVLNAVGFYMVFVYVVTYLQQVVHVQAARALDINTINMVLLLLLVPVAGGLSDRIGRKPVLVGAASARSCSPGVLADAPPRRQADTRRPNGLCRVGWAVPWCRPSDDGRGVSGAGALRALSFGYNLCLGVLGGTTPLVTAYLITRSHNDLSPAFYLMAAALAISSS